MTPVSDAVAQLYRAHFDFVWRTLLRLGVGRDAVEDAVHDVFTVVHRRWGDFEGRSSARTWLFAVTRRVAWRHRRSLGRRIHRRAVLARVQVEPPSSPESVAMEGQAHEALVAFLEQLEPPLRDAFVLGALEGLGRREMGEALGINPNTAYSRLRIARQRFERAFVEAEARQRVEGAAPEADASVRQRVWLALTIGTPKTLVVGWGVAAAGLALAGVSLGSSPSSPGATVVSRQLDGLVHAQRVRVEVDVRPSQVAQASPIPPSSDPVASVRARRRPRSAPAGPEVVEADASDGVDDGLEAVVRGLAVARRAVQRGDPAEALQLLAALQTDPGATRMAAEVGAIRVSALCAIGRAEEARAQARALPPGYRGALQGSCVDAVINPDPFGDPR